MEKIKETKQIPKTIREFKYTWIIPQYHSYSDEQIKWLLKKLLQTKTLE